MSRDNIAISVKNVHKEFKLPHEKQNSIKGLFVSMLHRKRRIDRQKVLKGVSLEIKKGEFFGIVGRNGSGKSTLLKLLAGIYAPDAGTIKVNGKITPFIELGVGFNPDLTGRENVYLNGALLGFTRQEVKEMYGDIVSFAELEGFMSQKLKNYSSGMQVRLAFSIAVRAKSDILILDEVLAVGDSSFQRKCYDYFTTLKGGKTTVVLVTHDMSAVEKFCTRAMVLDSGKVDYIGVPNKAAITYDRINAARGDEVVDEKQDENIWGSREAIVESIHCNGETLKIGSLVEVSQGEKLEINLTFSSKTKELPITVGLAFRDLTGNNIAGPNSAGTSIKASEKISYIVDSNPLNPNDYWVTIAVYDKNEINEYFHIEKAFKLRVQSVGRKHHGFIDMLGKWK